MSYIQGLGALTLATMVKAPIKAPFPGAVWNPPSGGKAGFWSRPVSSGGAKATVVATESPLTILKKQCAAAGYPQRVCSQIKAGWTMKDVDNAAIAFSEATTREKRPEVLAQQCAATGMPADLIPQCVSGLQAGVSMDEIIETLQSGGVAAGAPRKSHLLLYGGIAAAGIGAFLLLRKRKKKS